MTAVPMIDDATLFVLIFAYLGAYIACLGSLAWMARRRPSS